MIPLTPMQVRVLGCLMEKKETTPDQYPLTLNAVRTACNQKTSRHPVTQFTEGEVGHTLRELEGLGLAREEWGARVPKYSHVADKALGLYSPGIAVLCCLMLRGPQTLGEIRTHTHRLHAFDDTDDVHHVLKRLEGHEPPLVMPLPRQAGQKEGRFIHLLCGEPDLAKLAATPVGAPKSGLEARVSALETELEVLRQRLDALEGNSG